MQSSLLLFGPVRVALLASFTSITVSDDVEVLCHACMQQHGPLGAALTPCSSHSTPLSLGAALTWCRSHLVHLLLTPVVAVVLLLEALDTQAALCGC